MSAAITTLILATVGLVALVVLRPSLTRGRGGRILAFLALFALPIAATQLGIVAHLEQSKSTEFCLSCHVMEPYGESLWVDDPGALPANHFQNNRVPRDQACFTCHTEYTMYGDVSAKLKGLRHVWIYYLGEVPETLALYEPYANRECLHCHAGARSFEEDELHAELRTELASGETSCLECHDVVHAVGELARAPRWQPEAEE